MVSSRLLHYRERTDMASQAILARTCKPSLAQLGDLYGEGPRLPHHDAYYPRCLVLV